jgi:hypothetical protein
MENIYSPKKKRFSFPSFKRKKSTSSLNEGFDTSKPNKPKFKIKINWKLILKILGVLVLLLFGLAVFAWFYLGKPAYAIYGAAKDLKVSSADMQAALKTQDLGKIENSLNAFKEDYAEFKTVYYENSSRFENLPIAKDYVADVNHLFAAGDSGIELGFLVIDTLDPYAAELGLKEGSTKFNNEQRIQQLAQVLPKFVEDVDAISMHLNDIDNELSQIDATKYPEEIRGIKVQSQITSIQTVFSQLAEKSPMFKGLFEQLPTLIGVDEPKTYLVVMANSTELRMGGGFTTYSVVVEVANGVPKIVKSVDTYMIDVDNFALENRDVPPFVRNYLVVNRLYARDAFSVYPSFVDGADLFIDRYWNLHQGSPAIGTLPPVDGVISVNTHLAEALLETLGPVDVTGRSFLTDEGTYKGFDTTEFNSENVIYNLEVIANAQLSEIAGRKDIIQFLMESMLDKTLNAKTENLADLARVFLEALGSKDLMVYVFDEEAQAAIEQIGYAGTLTQPVSTQDYLLVAHSNFGAGKRDWIVTRKTEKEVYTKNGKNMSEVTITINNPKAPDWWHPSWLYTYKDYIRLYVPKGSKLVSANASDGSELNAQQTDYEYRDVSYPGVEYIEMNIWVDEGKTTTVTVEYELPDTVDMQNYELMLQKQSGTHGDVYLIKKDGNEKNLILEEDSIIKL